MSREQWPRAWSLGGWRLDGAGLASHQLVGAVGCGLGALVGVCWWGGACDPSGGAASEGGGQEQVVQAPGRSAMSVTLGTAPGALGWPLVTLGSGSVEGEPVSAVSVEFCSKGEQGVRDVDQELVWWPASELRRVWKTGRGRGPQRPCWACAGQPG